MLSGAAATRDVENLAAIPALLNDTWAAAPAFPAKPPTRPTAILRDLDANAGVKSMFGFALAYGLAGDARHVIDTHLEPSHLELHVIL